MPPRRSARAVPSPLTDEQVDQLRADVQAGRAPRVVIRTPSAGLPAGTRGPVLRVGDPSVQSEFIVVRLSGDEIPFAPGELALPGAAGRRTPEKQGSPPSEVLEPESATPAVSAPAGAPAAVSRPRKRAEKPPLRTAAPATPAAAKRTSARVGRRKPPGPVHLTLRFADGRWTAEAARGGKRVGGKAVPVRAGAVAALAELIDDAQVSGLIAETVEACRSEVEERASQLREQLAEAERALREYDR